MGKPMTAQRSHKYFYNAHTHTYTHAHRWAAILFGGQRPQTQMQFNYYIWPALHRFFIRIYLLIYLNIYLLYLLDSHCFIFALLQGISMRASIMYNMWNYVGKEERLYSMITSLITARSCRWKEVEAGKMDLRRAVGEENRW